MRKIKDVLRLKFDGKLSNAKIARSINIGETTVEQYLFRARKADLTWPLPEDMDNEKLEAILYPPKEVSPDGYDLPNFEHIHKEIKRKGVTLQLLWEEYNSNQKGYSYSQFCNMYKLWKATDETWMIQTHKAGVNTFIDYAGLTISIFDPSTGLEAFNAQIFVSALGASSFIFCEATKSQTIEDWIGSHKRMNEYFGGVTECWVPDNLKSGITCANRYEPTPNRCYRDLADHYGVHIIPARVRKPKDKSKAEGGVYVVETQILAPLRDRKFYNLAELNGAIMNLLEALNKKPFQKMPGSSRYSLYLEIDKPALKPLPDMPYELSHWGKEKVGQSYHLTIEGVPYSVPYTFVLKDVEYRYNERTVEIFINDKLIALHGRSYEKGVPVTNNNHRPSKHQYQAQCTPEEIRKQARAIGEDCAVWVDCIFEDSFLHMTSRINRTLGVIRLAKTYENSRLNAACKRGLFYKNFLYQGIKDILKNNLDRQPLPVEETSGILPQDHNNIRGPIYYQ